VLRSTEVHPEFFWFVDHHAAKSRNFALALSSREHRGNLDLESEGEFFWFVDRHAAKSRNFAFALRSREHRGNLDLESEDEFFLVC
jgi:hypothetical protein